jgi:NADH-quinone oxidoreductase subunit H
MIEIISILIFPGLLFLTVIGLLAEYIDRKLYARFQNRVGPPWFQPLADLIKLFAKSEVIPEEADRVMFMLVPLIALAATVSAYLYIPIWGTQALAYFPADLVVVLYLLTLPTFSFFLGGWYSRSLYATIGAIRSVTQLFAYEIPLLLSILASALLANTWSLSAMAVFYNEHPWYWLFNLVGFGVALIALMGKLERVPFDIPEAETEIVAGSFTEYSGRFLAFFRWAIDLEVIVGSSLLAVVFLPFGLGLAPWLVFVLYLLKIFFIIFLLALFRTVLARLRIDQMVDFCWRIVAPVAFAQVLFNLFLKGFIL